MVEMLDTWLASSRYMEAGPFDSLSSTGCIWLVPYKTAKLLGTTGKRMISVPLEGFPPVK